MVWVQFIQIQVLIGVFTHIQDSAKNYGTKYMYDDHAYNSFARVPLHVSCDDSRAVQRACVLCGFTGWVYMIESHNQSFHFHQSICFGFYTSFLKSSFCKVSVFRCVFIIIICVNEWVKWNKYLHFCIKCHHVMTRCLRPLLNNW